MMDKDKRFEQIRQSIGDSPKKVTVLPVVESVLKDISSFYDIRRESLLGTVIHNTGGIIVDDWLRIYGAGKADFHRRNRDFPASNILVAEDVLGGLFAITDGGTVGYFAPDTLEWEDNGLNYSEFLYWCLHGDTDTFYMDYRWRSWKDDVSGLATENGIAFYPFLWAEAELEQRSRAEIHMEEILRLEFDFADRFENGR